MASSKEKVGAAAIANKSVRSDSAAGLSDDAVREFLKDNGDFLQRNPDLLDHLHVSHASGSAVSLVEKQVSVLRERNVEIRHRLNALTANARENDKLFEQTQALVLKLIEADSIAGLHRSFIDSMQCGFAVEFSSMILFEENPGNRDYRVDTLDNAMSHIGALLGGHKAVCGALRPEEFNYLFTGNEHAFQQEGSAAIVPLTEGAIITGLVAVGSADASRYTSDMDVLFLSHIAEVSLRLLPRLEAAG